MVASAWDQTLLAKPCSCGSELRITYDFPRQNKEVLQVIRMVGVEWTPEYLMMLWETAPASDPSERWFDFKYIRGRNPWGLNKAAVFPQELLKALFALLPSKGWRRGISITGSRQTSRCYGVGSDVSFVEFPVAQRGR
jgi:hypothetical protein